ncbi:MAG: GMP synthase subunit A [Candidatus Bilamarchaeaceae archaeon]
MILIIDNGSQYTHLIKRNYRDMGMVVEIINAREKYEDVRERIEGADALILSGGPNSVYAESKENLSKATCRLIREGEIQKPLLGICYGHQMIGYVWGANVAKGGSAEYGVSDIIIDDEDAILKGLPKKFRAWVSHYDEVKEIPTGFIRLAHSETCKIEAMRHNTMPIFGVQFHPEVWHTEHGEKILRNFLEAANVGGI